MNLQVLLVVLCWNFISSSGLTLGGKSNAAGNVKVAENRLALQIFAMIDHFKQDDPIGLPGVPIPDPMEIPDMEQQITLTKVYMKKMKVYGLSKFRIIYMKSDLLRLKVQSGLQMDEMSTLGTYEMKMFLSKSTGPFQVYLKNVMCYGNATLSVERDGKLRTQDIAMDITFDSMSMNFENLGTAGAVLQGVVNSAPNLIFDTIKPFMLKEAYQKMKHEIDSNIEKYSVGHTFSNSISPLDMAVAEARKKIRLMGYDPYRIVDYNQTVGVFAVQMSNTWVTGVSSFYRVGNVTVTVVDNTVTMGMQIGTQKIMGSTQWEMSMGFITRSGRAQFSIDHFKVSYEIMQPFDISKRAQIKELQLELGNIQVRCDGAGTIDYLVELAVNIMPNVLRYQIMDAIENPVKMRVQEEMDKFDMEEFIRNNVTNFIEKGGGDFNLDFNLNF